MSDKSQFNIWCRAFTRVDCCAKCKWSSFLIYLSTQSALYNMSHLLNHTTTFSTLKCLKHTHTHTKNQTPKQNKKPTENREVQGWTENE